MTDAPDEQELRRLELRFTRETVECLREIADVVGVNLNAGIEAGAEIFCRIYRSKARHPPEEWEVPELSIQEWIARAHEIEQERKDRRRARRKPRKS